MRVKDEAPLSLVAMVRGEAWVVPDRGEPIMLVGGDVALLRGDEPYVFADDPATSPQVVIHPGQHCTTPDGHDLSQQMDLGVRSWGNDPNGSSVFLIGTYEHQSELSRRLVEALPPHVILSSEQWSSPLLGLLADEITKDEPGQQVVLDRLLDLIVIAVLRAWFSLQEARTRPRGTSGSAIRSSGDALRMMQNNPAHPWTVAGLASEVGVSRGTRRDGSPKSSANRRCRCSRRGDSRSPPDQLRDSTRASARWQVVWATAARSLSALRSSAPTESVPTTYRRGELARATGMSLIRDRGVEGWAVRDLNP